jgi:hypothetical protein
MKPVETGNPHSTSFAFERMVIAFVAVSFLIRLICAAALPLSGDEALYWSYSKHLNWGYIDHPIMNPLVIRIGTFFLGDTPLGTRVVPLLLSLPATWAIWKTGEILLGSKRAGATAALLFNLTIAVSVGSFIATSDSSVIVTSAFTLLALARLERSENPKRWIEVGFWIGMGMLTKYTTVFLALGILTWLVIVPTRRKWLINRYSFLGGIISLGFFLLVLKWNSEHSWISFIYQAGRTTVHVWTLKYLGDFLASQIGFLTPPIFLLGVLGIFGRSKQSAIVPSAKALIVSLIAPMFLYFTWHSLHERVEGNWLEVMYPAYVIAAAMAIERAGKAGLGSKFIMWSRRLLLPFGVGLALIIYVQALFGVMPLGRKDPTSRELAFGWPEISLAIQTIKQQTGAESIITSDYTTNSWLRFYSPKTLIVTQINERLRWANEPPPPSDTFNKPMLYICRDSCQFLDDVQSGFDHFETVETLGRRRHGLPIETYSIFLVSGPRRPPFEFIDMPFVKGQS